MLEEIFTYYENTITEKGIVYHDSREKIIDVFRLLEQSLQKSTRNIQFMTLEIYQNVATYSYQEAMKAW